MLNLLALEWKKFRKNSVVSLLCFFYVLFLPAGLLLLKDFDTEGMPIFMPGPQTFYSFPGVWEYLGYAGNWVVFFFLGVVAIYLVTSEINYKTQRQTIINGMSRSTYFLSKLSAVFAISIFATLYYAIVAFAIGVYFTDDWDFAYALDNNWAISRYFLMSICYLSFALMLGFLLRKAGLAIFVYMSYVLIIELLIRMGLRWKLTSGELTNHFPLNAIEDLMPMPFWKYTEMIPTNIDFEFLLPMRNAVMVSTLALIVFILLARFLLMKRDI